MNRLKEVRDMEETGRGVSLDVQNKSLLQHSSPLLAALYASVSSTLSSSPYLQGQLYNIPCLPEQFWAGVVAGHRHNHHSSSS
jgi:hypothetical protein